MSLWYSGQGVSLHVQINQVRLPATLFSVSMYRFFSVWSLFLTLFFLLAFFFFILTADPAGHALGSIYILSASPEFYFGKGISKALDLHTGQAYDQKKTKSCQLKTCPSSETAEFFSVLVNTQYTTNCTNLHTTPTSDPPAKV